MSGYASFEARLISKGDLSVSIQQLQGLRSMVFIILVVRDLTGNG